LAPRCGLGLRAAQLRELLASRAELPFLEVLAENHLQPGDASHAALDELRACTPLTLHSVGMSLGSSDPLDWRHLGRLRELERRLEPALVSDHLAWVSLDGRHFHELLPLPYLEEAIAHTAERIARVQDFFGRRIALENVASYTRYAESELSEWEFLSAVAERADCWLLLDVSNAFVSARNHGFSAEAYLAALPRERVVQFHLAGHGERDGLLIDTHGAPVAPQVLALFERAVRHFGALPTVLERDRNFPPLGESLDEAAKIDACLARHRADAG
jgi:hypothetical protein